MSARPVHRHNLDDLIHQLSADFEKLGIKLFVPPVGSWRKHPVTGEIKEPAESAGQFGEQITFGFSNPYLTEKFNLHACTKYLQAYLDDLSKILFEPHDSCTRILEELGPLLVTSTMKDSPRYSLSYYDREMVSLLMKSMCKVSQWGCAWEYHYEMSDGHYREDDMPNIDDVMESIETKSRSWIEAYEKELAAKRIPTNGLYI